jgi:3-oxoacyl-[acyl-carrier protein] reductase
MTDLRGKVAVITGSTRGIGKAIALRYASCGARIVVNGCGDATDADNALQEIRDLGGDAIAVRADVSKVSDLDRLFAEALNQFDKVDIVVANAGVEIMGQPMLDASEEDYDRLFAVNAKGAFFTLQRAGRHVSDNGRIIYIGSTATVAAYPGVALYGASKNAARHAVRVLALEVGRRGVTVNTILPTAIQGAGVFTDVTPDDPFVRENAGARPIGARLGLPGDVADAAEYLAGDLAAWMSGHELYITGGAPQ